MFDITTTMNIISVSLIIVIMPLVIKDIFMPNLTSFHFTSNSLQTLITEEDITANRYKFTITTYNYKDFMPVNADKLTNKNYLVNIEKSSSYLFNDKTKIVITEAHKELPPSRTKGECFEALYKAIDLTFQYTDKNNETNCVYIKPSNSTGKKLMIGMFDYEWRIL